MKKTEENQPAKNTRQPYRVRVPRFITEKEIGLGEVVKRVTYAAGITPNNDCGCERRAATLNRWLRLTPRRPK